MLLPPLQPPACHDPCMGNRLAPRLCCLLFPPAFLQADIQYEFEMAGKVLHVTRDCKARAALVEFDRYGSHYSTAIAAGVAHCCPALVWCNGALYDSCCLSPTLLGVKDQKVEACGIWSEHSRHTGR